MNKEKSINHLKKSNPQKRGTKKSTQSQKRIKRDLKFLNRMINNRNSAFYNGFRFDDFSNDSDFIFFKEKIMKKNFGALFAIAMIAMFFANAFANESLTSVGVGIPIMRYEWSDVEENGNGVQFALKEHYIFDNGFSLVADLGLGNMKIKDYWLSYVYDYNGNFMYSEREDGKAFYLNFDIGAGYAVLNYQKFKLVISALAGIGFQKYNKNFSFNELTDRFITFDMGLDLYGAFKFTERFWAFISCKGMYSIGKGKVENKSTTSVYPSFEEEWTLKGFMITPSAGLVICF